MNVYNTLHSLQTKYRELWGMVEELLSEIEECCERILSSVYDMATTQMES